MNANPWSAPKSREIRRMLVSLDERVASACELVDDNGDDPLIVTLRYAELDSLRAHVYLHGQRSAKAATPSTTWLALINALAGTPGLSPSSSTASLVTTA